MIDDDTVSMPICDVEEAAHAFSTVGVEMRVERTKDRSAFSVGLKDDPMGGAQLVRTS